MAPTFNRVGALPLYALSSSGDAAPVPFWAGYRPSEHASFGAQASLDEAWRDAGGVYVFLGAAPTSTADFSAGLDALLARLSPTRAVRLLWIEDPNRTPALWACTPVLATATGSGPSIAWQVARAAQLALGEYAVELAPGTALTQADANTQGFGIAAASAAFTAPGGSYAASAGSVWLPFTGATVGCVRARLTLPAGRDQLAALRVQVRYGAPQTDGAEGDGVDVLALGVIAQGAAPITLYLSFDPVHPLVADRTRLGFFDDVGGGAAPTFAATLRTSRGYATTLTPTARGAPLRPARLAFGRTPLSVGDPSTTPFVFHLTPDGAFDLAVLTTQTPAIDSRQRLMLGRSGLEYAALPAGVGAIALFAAGRPALALSAAPHPLPTKAGDPLLSDLASTAHLALLAPQSGAPGLPYFAQPVQAPLFAGEQSSLPAGFLPLLELQAATLPAWTTGVGTPPPTLPAAPLAGAESAEGELADRVEAVLAPARRLALGVTSTSGEDDPQTATLAVTPQGLQVGIAGGTIDQLVIATLGGASQRRLTLTSVGPRLRGVLQAGELFAAIADPTVLLADSSVPYRLDDAGLATAAQRGVPASVIAALRPIVTPGGVPVVYTDEAAFVHAIEAVAGTYVALLCKIAGYLQAVLSDWVIQLSPRAWRTESDPPLATDAPTIMLLKYAHRPLEALVEDAAAWAWPQAGALPHGGVAATQARLRTIFAAARARDRAADPAISATDPYAAFYRDVVADPGWNGVLFLNAPVTIGQLPSALRFVAAGVDPARFYAHHVGFSATPVEVAGGAIVTRQTAAFGLIDYDDPYDLTLDPSELEPVPFAFKTLRLTARFANAELADFSTRAELMVNELLAARLTKRDPTHGNNLILTGSLQRATGGSSSYVFALEGAENRYSAADRSMLDTVDVARLRLLTRETGGGGALVTSFVLGGALRFAETPNFDAFGYGPTLEVQGSEERIVDGWLSFDGLTVEMRFAPDTPTRQSFAVDLTGVQLDPSSSQARPNALVSRFPVTLAGLLAAPAGQPPENLGYISVAARFDQTPLPGPWFGLSYSLDLGTLGGLTDGAPLTLGLVAAWGPGAAPEQRPAYLGLLLPGYADGSFAWPLQGVMQLGFRSFQFEAGEDDQGVRSYALRLRRLALSILGLALPPGNVDLVLFGDPAAPASRVVGWYAAYVPPAAKPIEAVL